MSFACALLGIILLLAPLGEKVKNIPPILFFISAMAFIAYAFMLLILAVILYHLTKTKTNDTE